MKHQETQPPSTPSSTAKRKTSPWAPARLHLPGTGRNPHQTSAKEHSNSPIAVQPLQAPLRPSATDFNFANISIHSPLRGTNRVVQRKSIQRSPQKGPSSAPVRKEIKRTSLPESLKTGIEHLSGMSMDGVKVHYNSPQSETLNAAAHTQGDDIHVGPGQEKHLAHEAWHVVQQRQRRVKPTLEFAGTPINDDPSLEREADVMGAKAAAKALPTSSAKQPSPISRSISPSGSVPSSHGPSNNSAVVQRVLLKADEETPHPEGAKFTHLAKTYKTNKAIMAKVQAMHDDPTDHQMTLKQAVDHCRASKKTKQTGTSELLDYESETDTVPHQTTSKKRKRRRVKSQTKGGASHTETHLYDSSGEFIQEKESETTGMHFVPGTRQDAHADPDQEDDTVPWATVGYDSPFLQHPRRPPKNVAKAHRSPGFGDMQAGGKFHNDDVTSTERNQQHSKFESRVRKDPKFKESKKFAWQTKTTHQPVKGHEDEIAEKLAKKPGARRSKKQFKRKIEQVTERRPKMTVMSSDERKFTAEDGTTMQSGDLGEDLTKVVPHRYLSEDADITEKYARAQRHGGNQAIGNVEMLSSDESSSDFEDKPPKKKKTTRKTRPPTPAEEAHVRRMRMAAKKRYEKAGKAPKSELEDYFEEPEDT